MNKTSLFAALIAVFLLSNCDNSNSKQKVLSAPVLKASKMTITTTTLPSDVVMAQYILLKKTQSLEFYPIRFI